MEVKLLNYTPIAIADTAISKCWDKEKGYVDLDRIERVALKFKHSSTIEHLVYTFDISGISRALLQELARHRIASYSVKSTRYTLKELKDEKPFTFDDKDRASKYVVLTGDTTVDYMIVNNLDNLRTLLARNISNDVAKYAIPEAYKTSLIWTINARSLQNFLALRSSKDALWEIRYLAYEVYNVIPSDHKFLFTPFIKEKQ
jgi:thymidylate synthase (FAD)